jgi:hypothetical protein
MLNAETPMGDAKPARKRVMSKVTSRARKGVVRFLDGDKRGPVARRFRDLVGEV